jgi:hypothetical protein
MLFESRMIRRPAAEIERALLDHGPDLLAQAAGSTLWPGESGADDSFAIDLPAQWAGIDLAKRVQVSLGTPRRLAGRLILPIAWSSAPGRHLFPLFDGTIEVEALYRDVTELTLAGSYRVPLGPVGAALDTALLQAAARDTAARLVEALAAILGGHAGVVGNNESLRTLA